MARVVDHCGNQISGEIGDAGEGDGVVGVGVGIEPTGVETAFVVPVIAIGGHVAAPGGIGHQDGLDLRDGAGGRFMNFGGEIVQIGFDQFATGQRKPVRHKPTG